MPRCDVIIPIHNNATVLPATIEALAAQQVPRDWRVGILFSDDGSTDGSVDCAQAARLGTWSSTVVRGPHAGPGAARNRGIAASAADLLLLLGADILLQPGALAAHLRWHAEHPAAEMAALGFVQWDPRIHPSPLMQWMVHGGPQNDFDTLLGRTQTDPRHFFYASHLSIKRAFLQLESGPFAESFAGYGWEDLELGRRLAKRGLRLAVLHAARAWHAHHYSVGAICRRQEAVGRNLTQYQALHPTDPLLPPRSLRRRFRYWLVTVSGAALLIRAVVRYGEERWSLPRWYQYLTSIYFWRGVWRA